jgi:uncharacterized protein
MRAMKCPKCEAHELVSLTVDGIEVDHCSTCQGIWFDRHELGDLLQKEMEQVKPLLGGEDPDDHDHQTGICPRDQQRLLRVTSVRNHKVVLDTCHVCQGIWLDGGEFERIKTAQPGFSLGDLV